MCVNWLFSSRINFLIDLIFYTRKAELTTNKIRAYQRESENDETY